MKLRQKRTSVFILMVLAVVLAVAVLTVIVLHIFDIFGNRGAFRKGTTINGVGVSELTAKEAEEALQKAVDQYELTVTFADGTETYSAKELGLTVDGDNKLEELIREQKSAVGDVSGSASTESELELTVEDLILCKAENLEEIVSELPELTSCSGQISEDACLSYDTERAEFVVEPETVGGTIVAADLVEAIEHTAGLLSTELDAVAYGLYGGRAVRAADSEEVQSALTEAQKKLNLVLIYTYDIERADVHGEEEIDKGLLAEWLYVDEDGLTISVDEDRLQEYVEEMGRRYSVTTAGPSQFVTSIGTFVEVDAPATDGMVDNNALCNDIKDCIDNLYSGKRSAPYASTSAGIPGTTNLGGTYVEIDLDHQHLYLYVDSKLVAEGDICSGCVADGNATPEGLYTIKSKDHDRYLRGESYCDWVSYFMPFNGGIGLHDSTWRNEDEYGGEVYLDEGSHGCINMPLELVKTVDENVEVGTYVILYGGQPNPKWGAQSVYGTSHYTKSTDSDSFVLNAYTTGDGTLSYESSDNSVVTVDENGWVTINGPGTASITVTASCTANYARGTKEITVVVNDTV